EDHVFVRLDEVNHTDYPREVLEAVVGEATGRSTWAEAEVICNYGCGIFTPEVLGSLAGRPNRPRPCIVDSHDLHRTRGLRPDLITPNVEEFADLCAPLTTANRAEEAAGRQAELLRASGARAAIVTLDREGSILLGWGGQTHRTYAKPTTERQASGAGDTFTAALALA